MDHVTGQAVGLGPLVVGFDGSLDGLVALRWAAIDARSRKVVLRVVRAWQWDDELAMPLRHLSPADMQEVARERTLDALLKVDPGSSADADCIEVVVSGDEPGRGILSASHDALVAVVGRRRLSVTERLFVGSVGNFVVEHSNCPVVIVPVDSPQHEPPDLRPIVVGVDGSWESREALAFAAGEAARRGVSLTVLVGQLRHAPGDEFRAPLLSVSEELEEQRKLLHEASEQVRRRNGISGIPLELQVGTDRPGPCLAAAAVGSQLLVVGSHGRGWLGRLALGSVSRYCVQHSPVPVAVVPRP